jgi:hypothetical protein
MPESTVLKKAFLLVTFFLFLALPAAFSLAGDDAAPTNAPPQQAPSDPDVSDVCTLSDCNPAKPCADPDENCYTLNGVFYCCTMPPEPGMESVGD